MEPRRLCTSTRTAQTEPVTRAREAIQDNGVPSGFKSLVFFPLNAKQHRRAAGLEEGDHIMIVIERDGKTVVITGWRAWLQTTATAVTTAVLAALAFLVLGIAVSIVAFLLIVMPAVVIVAVVVWSFQPRRA